MSDLTKISKSFKKLFNLSYNQSMSFIRQINKKDHIYKVAKTFGFKAIQYDKYLWLLSKNNNTIVFNKETAEIVDIVEFENKLFNLNF